ncbi:MAG TPA: choice-of-anchor D domain-containing protein [Myxococcota bacterium]|nr:choice-of-anchor D domain-containing protein [Myxococcota bacterium]HRY92360.1 choice-of-anchor D domain-containing protein [Myxococcota bacterium]
MARANSCLLLCALGLVAWLAGCAPKDRLTSCTVDATCPEGQGCIAGTCLQVECRTNADCPSGEACSSHACVPAAACAADGDCPSGEVCDDEICRPGCRTQLECLPGVCDPVGRTCLACLDKGDCALGELCVDGACAPGCEGNRDCPDGLVCLPATPPHGQCVECAVDGDCQAGERCLSNQCQSPCAADGDCPAGEICEGGGCRTGCRDDLACPGGRCDPDSLACVECLEVDDCALGELCFEGACTPGCKGNRDCPAGLICLPDEPPHGACVECVPGQCPEEARACVEPLSLDFGAVPPGQTASLSFGIRSCGQAPLTVHGLSPSPGTSADFTVLSPSAPPVELPAGATLTVEVRYQPGQAGLDAGGVDVFSDDVSAEPATGLTATVALAGRSETSYCDLVVTPTALDFGLLDVGETRELELALTNEGNLDCVLEGVAISLNSAAQEFSLPRPVGPGTSLAPGGSLGVAVAYHPTDLGQDAGALTVLSDDVDGGELVVSLAGFGQSGATGPVAICTVDPTQPAPFAALVWDGSQSYDSSPNRTIQAWDWSVVSFPEGSAAGLTTSAPASRGTVIDLAGVYSAQLVVRNDIGQTSQPCVATAVMVPSQALWLELYWALPGDDMDLHLLAPNGIPRTRTDCYYANCVPSFGTTLDWGQAGVAEDNPVLALDDIPGLGPEVIYLPAPIDGVYTVFVHDYPGSVYSASNHVTMNVWVRGVLVDTFEQDLSGEDVDWNVCQVEFPSGVVTPL